MGPMTGPIRASDVEKVEVSAEDAVLARKKELGQVVRTKVAVKKADEQLNGKAVGSPDLHERLERKREARKAKPAKVLSVAEVVKAMKKKK